MHHCTDTAIFRFHVNEHVQGEGVVVVWYHWGAGGHTVCDRFHWVVLMTGQDILQLPLGQQNQMFVTKHQDLLQLSLGSPNQMFLTKYWDFLLFSGSIQPESFISIWGLFAAVFKKRQNWTSSSFSIDTA